MEDQQNSIDEIFRQSLGDYREVPPAASWDDVASRLDGDGSRPKGYFMKWPWISLLLLLIVGGAWFIVAQNKQDKITPKTIVTTSPVVNKLPTLTADDTRQIDTHSTANKIQERSNDAIAQQPSGRVKHSSAQKHRNRKVKNETQASDANPNDNTNAVVAGKRSTHHKTRSTTVASSNDADVAVNATTSRTHHASKGKTQDQRTSQNVQSLASGNKQQNSKDSPVVKASEKAIDDQHASANKDQPTLHKPSTNNSRKHKHTLNEPATSTDEQTAVAATNASNKSEHPKKQSQKVLKVKSASERESNSAAYTANTAGKKNSRKLIQANPFDVKSEDKTVNHSYKQSTEDAVAKAQPSTVKRRVKNQGPTIAKSKNEAPSIARQKQEKAITTNTPITLIPEKENTPPKAQPKENPNETIAAKEEPTTEDNDEADDETMGAGGQTTVPVRKHRRGLNLSAPLSLDLLAGYEWGLQQPAPNKGVFSLQFSWHLSTKISIGIIPAYRFGNIASQQIAGGDFGNFSPVQVDSFKTQDSVGGVSHDFYHYNIRQTYDSIRVPVSNVSGKYWDIELPVIFSFQANNWRFYGGPSFNFGGKVNVTTTGTQSSNTIFRVDSITRMDFQVPTDTFGNYFNSRLAPYSSYTPAKTDANSMRIGYTLGIGYQYQGFLFDVSVHQQLTGLSGLSPDVKKIYSSPGLRINVGYRLFGPRPMQRNAATERNFLQRL